MSTVNQQTLEELGASYRPLILEKGSYVPWASRFLRFLDNKKEEGELMRQSLDEGPYKRKEIPDPNNESKTIPEPLSKIHSRLMNEFDKFMALDKESLTSVYERFAALINFMARNDYVLKDALYDQLYDHLSQVEPHVNASKAKKTTRNHDPLALVANSHAHSSNSHASSSYSHSLQPYYVMHPSSVNDYEDDYQREIQGDAQEDKLTTVVMLLARAITQHYSTLTNN
ncbi:hypothetical protein Tco_0368902 [Tanacetum coccineum]